MLVVHHASNISTCSRRISFTRLVIIPLGARGKSFGCHVCKQFLLMLYTLIGAIILSINIQVGLNIYIFFVYFNFSHLGILNFFFCLIFFGLFIFYFLLIFFFIFFSASNFNIILTHREGHEFCTSIAYYEFLVYFLYFRGIEGKNINPKGKK